MDAARATCSLSSGFQQTSSSRSSGGTVRLVDWFLRRCLSGDVVSADSLSISCTTCLKDRNSTSACARVVSRSI